MQKVILEDLHLIDYKKCWDYQENAMQEIIEIKIKNREKSGNEKIKPNHKLIFCQHPHVYTLGKSGHEEYLLLNEAELKQFDAVFYKINRGGDITYHGPEQLVAYPIFDLEYFFTDIHKYLRFLEEAVIKTLADYGIKGDRFPGYTGVWIEPENEQKARKICAMGIRCSRWVTMHGLALNVNTDLNYFNHIIPCGIKDKDVTSMEKELGQKVSLNDVKLKLKNHLADLFNYQYI